MSQDARGNANPPTTGPDPSLGDDCGKDLAWWFTKAARTPPKKPRKPKPPITLAQLPPACRAVLTAP